jgi:superfamily II DNA or RNA helicase
MELIIVQKVNEVYLRILADDGIKAEMDDFFSFYKPGYQYSPSFKARHWDGKAHLFNKRTSMLFGGLLSHLKAFCKEREYSLFVDPKISENLNTTFTEEQAKEFAVQLKLHSNGKTITPHDYQIAAFVGAIKWKRYLLLSPTASGKSLVIYMICRYLLATDCKRGLIVVPTLGLIHQMLGDFKDYSAINKWNVDGSVQLIFEGQDKNITKSITISTWQSIYTASKQYLEQFDFVIGDEAHGFQAKSLTSIMTKMTNAKYRIGTTGTIDDKIVNRLTLEGHFGPQAKVVTTKELMDRGQIAELDIKCIILKYPEHLCKIVKEVEYAQELDFIVKNEARNKFITNLALDLNGNTLILFQFVEKHGKILYNILLDKTKDKPRKVFFVHGGVDAEDREAVRHITEKENDAIIVASFGVFSTGTNIRRLHNIMFASPSKSKIRNLQSIGRGLRLGDGKEKATLYDISDDLRVGKYVNYTMQHYAERMKTYHSEKFRISTFKVDLKNA